MNETYHVRVRGKTLGPYSLEAIRQMTRRAQVGRSHEISLDASSWAPATAFPEIFSRPVVPSGELAATAATSGTWPAIMWHYTQAGVQQSEPIEQSGLVNLISSGQVGPTDLVWCDAMSEWAAVSDVPELAMHAIPAARPLGLPSVGNVLPGELPALRQRSASPDQSPVYRQFVGKKTSAGVCALFLGSLGIHKFMLGLTTGGLTMLLLFFLIIPIPVLSMIALAEAVIYLSKTDEQFFRDYAVNKKQWF
jgi:TM2 domain-containing membrane protein YozV